MDDRNSREQLPLLIAEFNLRGKKQKFEMTNIPLSPLRDLLPGLLTLLPREDEAYGGSPRDEEEGGTREGERADQAAFRILFAAPFVLIRGREQRGRGRLRGLRGRDS